MSDVPDAGDTTNAIVIANDLLAQMRVDASPEAGLTALGGELSDYEEHIGQPLAVLFGSEAETLGLNLGDLRDPRAFLRASVCASGQVTLRTKMAVRVGIPAVAQVLGSLTVLGALPGGILGAAVSLVVYEGVERMCRGGDGLQEMAE